MKSDRLILRPWMIPQDLEAAFTIYSDPQVMKYLGDRQTVNTIEAAAERLQNILSHYSQLNNGTGYWAIVLQTTGNIVGSIIIKQLPDNQGNPTQDYEIGWHLRKDAWGKGYATEAAKILIHYGFTQLNLPVIYAVTHPDNRASIAVTQRLGMTPLGRTTKYYNTEVELFGLNRPT